PNRISDDSIHPRRRVHLLDAIGTAQLLRSYLSRSGFLFIADGSESKRTAGTHSQHTADNALLAHAHPNQRMLVTLLLQKLHHGDVVVKRGCSADDLIVVGWDHRHLG